jgi:hypothetical protein
LSILLLFGEGFVHSSFKKENPVYTKTKIFSVYGRARSDTHPENLDVQALFFGDTSGSVRG